MRILMFTPKYPPGGGGIACHVKNLSKALTDLGHEVAVISPSHSDSKSYTSSGVLVLRIKSRYLPSFPFPTLSSISFSPGLLRMMSKIIRGKPPQIVHVHGHHYPLNWFAVEYSKRNLIPTVLTLHGMYALSPYGGRTLTEDIFNRTIFRYLVGRTNAVIGLTTKVTEYAKRLGSSASYFTIPNGIHLECFLSNMDKRIEYRTKYRLPQKSKIILFIGRFTTGKGTIEAAYVARAFTKKYRHVFFFFVGGGPSKGEMKAILDGAENVRILDWQPSSVVHELYIASDICLLPSKSEALPITVMEAMAAQLHLVVTPVGGIPDILKEYPFKTYMTGSSPPLIMKALSDALNSKDYDERRKTEAIDYIKRFSWKEIAKETKRVYDCVRKETIIKSNV